VLPHINDNLQKNFFVLSKHFIPIFAAPSWLLPGAVHPICPLAMPLTAQLLAWATVGC